MDPGAKTLDERLYQTFKNWVTLGPCVHKVEVVPGQPRRDGLRSQDVSHVRGTSSFPSEGGRPDSVLTIEKRGRDDRRSEKRQSENNTLDTLFFLVKRSIPVGHFKRGSRGLVPDYLGRCKEGPMLSYFGGLPEIVLKGGVSECRRGKYEGIFGGTSRY